MSLHSRSAYIFQFSIGQEVVNSERKKRLIFYNSLGWPALSGLTRDDVCTATQHHIRTKTNGQQALILLSLWESLHRGFRPQSETMCTYGDQLQKVVHHNQSHCYFICSVNNECNVHVMNHHVALHVRNTYPPCWRGANPVLYNMWAHVPGRRLPVHGSKTCCQGWWATLTCTCARTPPYVGSYVHALRVQDARPGEPQRMLWRPRRKADATGGEEARALPMRWVCCDALQASTPHAARFSRTFERLLPRVINHAGTACLHAEAAFAIISDQRHCLCLRVFAPLLLVSAPGPTGPGGCSRGACLVPPVCASAFKRRSVGSVCPDSGPAGTESSGWCHGQLAVARIGDALSRDFLWSGAASACTHTWHAPMGHGISAQTLLTQQCFFFVTRNSSIWEPLKLPSIMTHQYQHSILLRKGPTAWDGPNPQWWQLWNGSAECTQLMAWYVFFMHGGALFYAKQLHRLHKRAGKERNVKHSLVGKHMYSKIHR